MRPTQFQHGFALIYLLIAVIAVSGVFIVILRVFLKSTNSPSLITKLETKGFLLPSPTPNSRECSGSEKQLPLFTDKIGEQNLLPSPNRFTVRQRLVHLNSQAFMEASQESDWSDVRTNKANKILLNPFPGICATAVLDKIYNHQIGSGFIWSGYTGTENSEATEVSFSVGEGVMTGNFRIDNIPYQIGGLSNGIYVIREINPTVPVIQ